MHYEAMFKGDYIQAVEFNGKAPTLTITKLTFVDMEDDTGKTRSKGVLWFRETDRGWVMNRTNAQCLAAMFGHETDDWMGRRVTLVSEIVSVGKQKKLGIRVKGSPEIDRSIDATIVLPRRKPTTRRLVPTGRKAETSAPNEPEPSREPGDDGEE